MRSVMMATAIVLGTSVGGVGLGASVAHAQSFLLDYFNNLFKAGPANWTFAGQLLCSEYSSVACKPPNLTATHSIGGLQEIDCLGWLKHSCATTGAGGVCWGGSPATSHGCQH